MSTVRIVSSQLGKGYSLLTGMDEQSQYDIQIIRGIAQIVLSGCCDELPLTSQQAVNLPEADYQYHTQNQDYDKAYLYLECYGNQGRNSPDNDDCA